MIQASEKTQLVQLVNDWRERSNLSVKQIVARIQAQGCDISRAMFENRFIRYDQQPDIAPDLTLAVIAAFTDGLTQQERCTAAEAIELGKLTHLPIDQFDKMSCFFSDDAFDRAFGQYVPRLDLTALSTSDQAAEATAAPLTPLPLHFPTKAHHHLIGRTQELERLLAALREPERKPIVAVVGLGGIGKTALAQEAMEHCWREGLFAHIVWASAKTERFVGGGTRKTEVSDYSFEQLLDDIGRQCQRPDIPKLPADQKRPLVKHLLMNERVLVVLDNLETIPDSEGLVDDLFQILGISTALITSRHQLRLEHIFTLDLSGLIAQEGITFLREDSETRGIILVAQASTDDLTEIHQVTGGAPLAMKLVVGQMSRFPMKQVLNNLRAAKFAGPNYAFYRFIFQHSWQMLELEAQKVLVSMSVFDLANGSTETALHRISQVAPEAVQPALDQLILLSLVDVLGDLDTRRYALHALTHYFILSDIVKQWS